MNQPFPSSPPPIAPTPLASAAARKPYRCPVCEGRGLVRRGFYYQDEPYAPLACDISATTTCRACQGKGLLWA